MRIYKLEFGIITDNEGKPLKLEDRIYRLEYEPGACGCHIYSFGKFYLTLLGDECYFEILREKSNERRKQKRNCCQRARDYLSKIGRSIS